MGLDIKTYHYSYSMLQTLRQAAIYCCGYNFNVYDFYKRADRADYPFSIFVNFCDCEGMYVSIKSKQYDKLKKYAQRTFEGPVNMYFGNLDELKTFVASINESMLEHFSDNLSYLGAWKAFYKDVSSSRMILRFH